MPWICPGRASFCKQFAAMRNAAWQRLRAPLAPSRMTAWVVRESPGRLSRKWWRWIKALQLMAPWLQRKPCGVHSTSCDLRGVVEVGEQLLQVNERSVASLTRREILELLQEGDPPIPHGVLEGQTHHRKTAESRRILFNAEHPEPWAFDFETFPALAGCRVDANGRAGWAGGWGGWFGPKSNLGNWRRGDHSQPSLLDSFVSGCSPFCLACRGVAGQCFPTEGGNACAPGSAPNGAPGGAASSAPGGGGAAFRQGGPKGQECSV